MNPLVKVAGAHTGERTRAYWDGTGGALVEGDFVCFDEAATVDAANDYEARGVVVTRPETENAPFLAGVVAPGQSLTEAGYVEITPIRLGVPFKGKVAATSVLVGDLLTLTDDNYALNTEVNPSSYAASLIDLPVFVALEANSSGTNLRLLMLKKG